MMADMVGYIFEFLAFRYCMASRIRLEMKTGRGFPISFHLHCASDWRSITESRVLQFVLIFVSIF